MESVAVSTEFLDVIYKFGVLPLLLIAVIILWKRQGTMEAQINKLHEAQKSDLRSHGEEVKALQQETINALMAHQEFQRRTIELLKEIKGND